ncbi:MAG: hypothetical protein CMH57_13355 [Myxococcales bacterium]|nr:hypothetical protein [Myxococcales bacterium]
MNRWITIMLGGLALLGALGACGPASQVTVPDGYVELDEDELYGSMAQKLVSADGAVVLVREREHEPSGSLDFWVEAFEREIALGRGYTLLESNPVKAGRLEGRLLHFKGSYREEVYLYDVALFVTEDLIITVETASLEEDRERHEAAFAAAVKSLSVN